MRLTPAIHFTSEKGYAAKLPFHPPQSYPELAFLDGATDSSNGVYAGVRELLRGLGYDAARYGTPEWSPLSDLVQPGGRVVLKPNFVRHFHDDPDGDMEAVVTHPSVLRPLIDYAQKAVGPSGSVVVADAPQYDCEIETLLEYNGLPALLSWYREVLGFEVEFRDLRVEFGSHIHGIQQEKRKLPGDPEGYQAVDLGDASEFSAMAEGQIQLLRGADYDEEVTIRHHCAGKNEYLVAKTVLNADLLINCAKIKTHKKAGVTLSMKNLIGVNGDKNWLPHYRSGFRENGGDEFPRPDAYARFRHFGTELARWFLKRGLGASIFRRIRSAEETTGLGGRHRNGNWYGNDTIWRTCLDLNKIVYQGDRCGALGGSTRRVLNVHDGIVAGEGEGPMGPSARPAGLLAAGEDPGALDVVLTWLMGFDWRKIPLLSHAVEDLAGGVRITGFRGDPEALPVVWIDEKGTREVPFSGIDLNLRFAAHRGWKGEIERDAGSTG